MSKERPFYADAQAFLGFPGELPRIEEGLMLDLALVTCAPPVGPCAESLDKTLVAIAQFKAELIRQEVRIVTTAWEADIDDGRLNVVLGLQNLSGDVVEMCDSFGLPRLWDAGVRVIALAYDTVNAYGSGCLNIDVGLTERGRTMIERMINHGGFILDLSHASHRMAREALEFIDKKNSNIPVMASHGGCYYAYPHFRNLPDDVLIAIAKHGGVVGIASLTFILHQVDNGEATFYKHLSHAVRVCGPEAVVVGSDVPYTKYTANEELAMIETMKRLIDPRGVWASRYPMYTPSFADPGKMEVIEDGLTPAYRESVIGLNLLHFFQRSLPK